MKYNFIVVCFIFEIQGDFYSDRRNERLRRIALLKSFCEQCFKKY